MRISPLKHTRKSRNQAGFTLVEMAIVMVIMGMVIASSAQLYTQWIKWQAGEDTRVSVKEAVSAITAYRDLYGRYPCPASLTATRENPNVGTPSATYGVATDCAETSGDYSIGAGFTAAGISRISAGAKDYTDNDTNVTASQTAVIRVGAIPFRSLNMDEKKAYDGYRNRLFYAVTEQLTDRKFFGPLGGAIEIRNDENASALDVPGSAHFFIFSAGEDGEGAFTMGGVRLPCTTGTKQSNNCDDDSTFQVASTATSGHGQAGQFDDIVAYATHKDMPLWEKGVDPSNPTAISTKLSGAVGVGQNASKIPGEEFQVEGILSTKDNPNTAAITEGNVDSSEICAYASGNTTCFPSRLIAGDLDVTPPTGGLKCPSGQYMIGIQNSAPVCVDEVQMVCPGGSYLAGINADGTLNCGILPPGSCQTEQREVCGTMKAVTAALHNSTRVITGGDNRWIEFTCNNGAWVQTNAGGECTCTPVSYPPGVESCADWSGGCGEAFTGTHTVQWSNTCPSGAWTGTVTNPGNCTCVPSVNTWTGPCPDGFNAGGVQYENRHVCGPSPHCGGWTEKGNTCSCSPFTEEQDVGCPANFTGQHIQKRNFTCPGGAGSPGSYGAWTTVKNTCACTEQVINTTESCPVGYSGSVAVKTTITCPSGTPVRTETASCTKEVGCRWKIQGTGPLQNSRAAIEDGDTCDCTKKNTSTACSAPAGNGKHQLASCTCGK
jgi:prepilin-type N-terminal cleavage/methylation domain-containing protein